MRKAQSPSSASSAGFLLLDSRMDPVIVNNLASEILSYPQAPDTIKGLDEFLNRKIHATLLARDPSSGSPLVSEIRSGKRLYFCRAFRVDARAKRYPQITLAVFLERGSVGSFSAIQVSERFKLTAREQEVLQFLLQGLTSKEIAERMRISPNTVKAFLRLIMIKMGVSTRSGIVGKAVTSKGPTAKTA